MGRLQRQLLIFLFIFKHSHGQNDNSTTDSNESARQKKFSIFSVVNFPNYQCTTFSSANTDTVMYGTCQSADTCTSVGGTADGNCASGFGVCCMLSVTSCGSTISQNLTYIQSSGFPTVYSTVGNCAYTFNTNSNICQIRLDFDKVVVNPPTVDGTFVISCSNDKVLAASTGSFTLPTLCGTLTGTHMYIETGKQTSSASLTFTTTALVAGVNRAWKVRTSFIECNSLSKPPPDCVQYFTGVSGTVQSYNFPNQVLPAQNYKNCFRQEAGYCAIDFSAVSSSAFQINQKLSAGGPFVAKRSVTGCVVAHVQIPSLASSDVNSNSEYYCGLYFSPVVGETTNANVRSDVLPFEVGFFTSSTLMFAGTPTIAASYSNGLPGFKLAYSQVPC